MEVKRMHILRFNIVALAILSLVEVGLMMQGNQRIATQQLYRSPVCMSQEQDLERKRPGTSCAWGESFRNRICLYRWQRHFRWSQRFDICECYRQLEYECGSRVLK